MNDPTLFNAGPPDPKKDATSAATEASVKEQKQLTHCTQSQPMPPSHHNAPAGTSELAALRVLPKVGSQRAKVLAFITDKGKRGATDEEGEQALGIRPNSYTPRRGELVTQGHVVDSGRRRLTLSNCNAAVWVLIELADNSEGVIE